MLSDSPVPSAGLSRARPVLWGSERGNRRAQADRRQREELRRSNIHSSYISTNLTTYSVTWQWLSCFQDIVAFPIMSYFFHSVAHSMSKCYIIVFVILHCSLLTALTAVTIKHTLETPSLCLKWKIIYCNESAHSDDSLKWNWKKEKRKYALAFKIWGQ